MRKSWTIALAVIAFLVSPWTCAQEAPPLTFTVTSFEVTGANPLDPAATAAALEPFKGEHNGLDGIYAATDALTRALVKAGFDFHRAILPAYEQDLGSGKIILEIVTITLADVKVRGMQHYSEASVRRSLPHLVPGTAVDRREVTRDLAVANLHPSKKLKLNFRESADTADAVDAVVQVEDSKPWTVFAGINNIGSEGSGGENVGNIDTGGNEGTGDTRMTVGGQYNNLTGHDDILTGSFTFSPDNLDDVRQYAGFYQLPVYPARGWFNAFFVRSDVDVNNVQGVFDIQGAGEFLGVNFRHQLRGVGRYHHFVTVGLQDRLFDTPIFTAVLGEFIPGISTKVRSRPWSLRYDAGYLWPTTSLDFYLDFNSNLTFGGHNNDFDYAKVRGPADTGWKALRFGALVTQRLPRGFNGVARLTGQYAAEALIPGEQLGFGGVNSVRGFEERTIAGDKGVIFNFEVWTPAVPQLYGVRFLGFVDVGHKVLQHPLVGQRHNDTISSIGLGMRWTWRENIAFAVDYGQPLANADGEASDRGNSKWHLDLQFRY